MFPDISFLLNNREGTKLIFTKTQRNTIQIQFKKLMRFNFYQLLNRKLNNIYKQSHPEFKIQRRQTTGVCACVSVSVSL